MAGRQAQYNFTAAPQQTNFMGSTPPRPTAGHLDLFHQQPPQQQPQQQRGAAIMGGRSWQPTTPTSPSPPVVASSSRPPAPIIYSSSSSTSSSSSSYGSSSSSLKYQQNQNQPQQSRQQRIDPSSRSNSQHLQQQTYIYAENGISSSSAATSTPRNNNASMLYDDEGIVGGVAGDARNGGLGQYQEDDQGQYEYATDSVTCENYGSDGGQQVLPNNGGVEGEIQIQDQDPASGSSDYVSSFCDIGSIAATAIVEMQSLWQQTGKTAWACAEVVRALHSEVARIFTSAVDAERAAVIALDARWVSAVRDFSLLHASLGSDAGGKLADIQDLPLYQRVEISESRNAVLLAEYEKRKAQRDEAKQSLLALWAEMSISAGDSLPDESDLSPEALDWFLDALKQAQTEKEDRELNCRTLLSEAISLSEELGIPTDLSDSTDSCQGGPHQKPMRLSMSDMKLTPEYGDTLQEVVMSLNTLKKEREGMVNKCQAAIINLNTFLGEDPSVSKNLFSSIKGLGADSISLYEAEVTRLEEAKRCYVDNQLTLIVEQIVSVWQNIGLEPPCIFAEHRDDPVDRLAALRAELTWLKKIETEKQKILSLIHKYEEVTREKVAFDKETSDSSRLNGRAAGKGLRLLAEEKERKRLSRLLVQIAQDLYGALREWSSFTPSVSTTTTSTSSAALPAYMQINLPKFETQDRQDYLALLQSQLRRVLPSTPGLRAQATMTTLTTLGATSIKRQGGPNNPGTPSKRSRTEQKH